MSGSLTTKEPLTEIEYNIYGFIKEFIQNNGYSPTIREIQDNFGYRTQTTIAGHVEKLRKKGYIACKPHMNKAVARSIRPTEEVERIFFVSPEKMNQAIIKLNTKGIRIGTNEIIELLSALNIKVK